MLQGINRIGKSWIGRTIVALLFGLLIVSFAIWGIGDVFRGNVRTQVATVAGRDISAETYRNAYQQEYQNLIRRSGRSVTPEQARALGLEERVLSRLVSEAVFDHEAKRYGVAVSDQAVINATHDEQAFKGPTGTFDQSRFNDTLRQSGMSEGQYVAEQRLVLARQQLGEALAGALRIPIAMREAVHRYGNEKRTAEVIRLDAQAAGEIAPPDEKTLRAFYDERKGSFRAPEYRALSLLKLDADALAKPGEVSDEDARAFYARVRDTQFGTPEKRTIQQIIFPTRADAEAAAAKIKAGTSFEELAKEQNVDEATLNLGTLAKGDIIDAATADAAFALPEGQVSDPIEGRFGTALIRAAKVEPGSLKPFDEVASQVKTEVARERARNDVQAVHDAIEDERAGAKALTQIAADRKLTLTQVPATDRSGRDKTGQAVAALTGQSAILNAAFRSEVGSDNEAVNLPGGGYVWYEVTGIDGARDRPFDEVRDQVAAEWRKAEIAQRLTDKARSLTERIDKGEAVSALAEELGRRWETVNDLERTRADEAMPGPVVARIFATPVGRGGSASGSDETRTVFKVTAANVPPFVTTTQEAGGAETQLRTLLFDDYLAQYLADAEKKLGVQLYRANIRRAIGGEG